MTTPINGHGQDPDRQITIEEWEDQVFKHYKIPENLRRAMVEQESQGDWSAKSKTGVRGKYQVTQKTARRYGLDRDDPYQQVVAAARTLRDNYDQLKNLADDDNARWLSAVGRYYGGPSGVDDDGNLSTKSSDGVSNPAIHARRVALKWAELNRGSGQSGNVLPPPKTPTPFSVPVSPPARPRTKDVPIRDRRLAAPFAPAGAESIINDALQRSGQPQLPAQRQGAPPTAPALRPGGMRVNIGQDRRMPSTPAVNARIDLQGRPHVQPKYSTTDEFLAAEQKQAQAQAVANQTVQAAAIEREKAMAPGGAGEWINRVGRGAMNITTGAIEGIGAMSSPFMAEAVKSEIGDPIRQWQSENMPIDPTRRGSANPLNADFWAVSLPQAIGSAVPFVLTGGAAARAGIGSRLAVAMLGASSNAAQTYQEALSAGYDERKARLSAGIGALIGMLEGAGSAGSVGQGVTGGLRNLIREIAEEGGQEAASELLNNVNAKLIAGYDPERAITEGVAEAGIVGGLLGGAMAGPSMIANRRAARTSPRAEQSDPRFPVQAVEGSPETQSAVQPPGNVLPPPLSPSPAETAPALPPGVQVVRQGDPIPQRQRGVRQVPIDITLPDGSTETVMVVAPETMGGRRTTETMLRPFAESAVVSPPSSAPAPAPIPQTAPSSPAAPIAQAGPAGLTAPTAPVRKKAGEDVQVFRPDEAPEYDPATQKIVTFKAHKQDFVAIVPKSMTRADAAVFARSKAPAPAPAPPPVQPKTPAVKADEPPPLLRPDAIVNPEGGIVPNSQQAAPGAPGAIFDQLAAKAKAPSDAGPVDLLSEVRKLGGIKDDGDTSGELRRLGLKEANTTGLMNNKTGLSPDRMREALVESGFSRAETVSDLFDEIEAAMRVGQKRGEQITEDEYYAKLEADELARQQDPDQAAVSEDMDPADAAAYKRLLSRYDADQPRPISTRPGEPGSGGVSFSPFNDLVTNNKETVARLAQMNLNSDEARNIIDNLREYADNRNIDQKHINALLAYAQNDQVERARLADQGVDFDQVRAYDDAPRTAGGEVVADGPEGRAINARLERARLDDRRAGLDIDALYDDSIRYVEEKHAVVDAKIRQIIDDSPLSERDVIELEVQAIDELFDITRMDSDMMDLYEAALKGGDAEFKVFAEAAGKAYGIAEQTVRNLVDSGQNYEKSRSVKSGSIAVEREARATGAPESRPGGDLVGSSGVNEQTLKILNQDVSAVADGEFDAFLDSLETLRNNQIKDPDSLPEWASREVFTKLREARDERKARVKDKRLPARFKVEQKTPFSKTDAARRFSASVRNEATQPEGQDENIDDLGDGFQRARKSKDPNQQGFFFEEESESGATPKPPDSVKTSVVDALRQKKPDGGMVLIADLRKAGLSDADILEASNKGEIALSRSNESKASLDRKRADYLVEKTPDGVEHFYVGASVRGNTIETKSVIKPGEEARETKYDAPAESQRGAKNVGAYVVVTLANGKTEYRPYKTLRYAVQGALSENRHAARERMAGRRGGWVASVISKEDLDAGRPSLDPTKVKLSDATEDKIIDKLIESEGDIEQYDLYRAFGAAKVEKALAKLVADGRVSRTGETIELVTNKGAASTGARVATAEGAAREAVQQAEADAHVEAAKQWKAKTPAELAASNEQAKSVVKIETPKDAPKPKTLKSKLSPERIESTKEAERIVSDFGEKIGGARKDTAVKLGTRSSGTAKPVDDRPAWSRPYRVSEVTKGYKAGKFEVLFRDEPLGYRGQFYDSRAEAEAAIPLIAVSKRHRVYAERGAGTYAIYRRIGENKTAIVKGGFASYDEAMAYMAKNPGEILEHQFQFPEKPWLDRVERIGDTKRTGNVKPVQFQEIFGFRGGEFGNWNMGSDGQAALNHAYDALMDLADVLGIPPRALSLDGELAIAFGARGKGGKNSGVAHYERDYAVINLTKIRGAGSLAHEWFHAVDHYLARVEGKASGEKLETGRFKTKSKVEDYLSHGFQRTGSKARPELKAAFENLIRTMTAKEEMLPVSDTLAQKQVDINAEGLSKSLADLRQSFLKQSEYNKRFKPPTEEQIREFDLLADKLLQGDVGERQTISSDRSRYNFRYSYEPLEALNNLYKKVTNRAFYTISTKGYESAGERIFRQTAGLIETRKRLAEASAGALEKKKSATDFFHESRKIDQFRVDSYWSTPHEMGARAFEAYIFDKLAGQGRRSDYLTAGVENKYYALLEMKPYPEGAERTAINKAFDELFSTIEIYETDRGFAMRNRAELARMGIDPAGRDWQPRYLDDAANDVEALRDVRIRRSKSKLREGVIYGNEQAHWYVYSAVAAISKDPGGFSGINLRADRARQIAKHLRSKDDWHKNDAAAKKALFDLADAFESAAAGGGNVQWIATDGFNWKSIRSTVYHELTHAAENKYKTTSGWFKAQPQAGKLAEYLSGKGYAERDFVSESVAHLLGGQRKMIGLSLDEAASFLDNYFANITFRHIDSVESFQDLHTTPDLRPTVREAKAKYGKRFRNETESLSKSDDGFSRARITGESGRGAPGVGSGRSGSDQKLAATSGNGQPGGKLTPRERLGQKLGTGQAIAQLLNPKTILQNLIGNAAFSGAKNAAAFAALPFDKLLSLWSGSRQVATPELRTQLQDFSAGFADVWHAVRTKDYSHLAQSKYDLNNERVFKSKVGKFLEDVMDVALRGPDRGAYLAAYNDSLQQILKAHAKSKKKFSLEKLHDQAKMEANQAIFQDENIISDFTVGLKRVLNRISPFGKEANFGLADVVGLKYPRVPAGLLARGIEYSPAGFVKAFWEAGRVLVGKPKDFSQREASLAVGKAFVGSTFGVGMGALLYALGVITQPEEKNKGVQAAERGEGLSGYQVNLSALKRYASGGLLDLIDGNTDAGKMQPGDRLMTYDWLQPWAFGLGMGAAALKGHRNAEDKSTLGDLYEQIDSVTATLTDQSIMRNVRDLFRYGPQAQARKVATDTAASFVPAILNQARQITDPTARDIERGEGLRGIAKEAKDKIQNRIPIASRKLPEKKDVVGRGVPSRLPGAAGAALVPLPGRFSEFRPHEVLSEMSEIEAGTTGVKRRPNESAAAFAARRALAQEWTNTYGLQLVRSDGYRKASKEEKKKAMELLRGRVARESKEPKPKLGKFASSEILKEARESLKRADKD